MYKQKKFKNLYISHGLDLRFFFVLQITVIHCMTTLQITSTNKLTANVLQYEIHKMVIPSGERIQYVVKHRGKCIDVLYYGDNPHAIELHGLSYHNDCFTNKNMNRGHDTVDMVKSSLIWITNNLRHEHNIYVSTIELSDTSTFHCFGNSMSLCAYNMLLYGKTYYERKFGAIPSYRDSLINNTRIKLFQIISTTTRNFELFSTLFDNPTDIEKARLYFDDKLTWNQLFYVYHLHYGYQFIATVMYKFYDSLSIYIHGIENIPFEIPRNTVDNWIEWYDMQPFFQATGGTIFNVSLFIQKRNNKRDKKNEKIRILKSRPTNFTVEDFE